MKRLREIIIAGLAVFGTVIGASAQLATYNLSADYSTNQNPSGVWAHGYLTNITSKFVQFSNLQRVDYGNGAAEMRWNRVADSLPEVVKFYFNTGTSDGGQGVYPPGTVLIFGGSANTSADYGAIRFTAPTGGVYSVTVGVTNYLNGASSGDTDFHVRINGGAFLSNALPATVATSYTFTTNLSAGGTIDFASGRGADNNLSGSGLKIGAIVTLNGNAGFQLSKQFPISANPSNNWTLGYKGATNGAFVTYTERYSATGGNSLFLGWMRIQGLESVARINVGPDPYASGAVIPVGGVILNPGPAGNPDNYAVARYTIQSSGNYRISAWAGPSFPSGQGDTDFHVLVNGVLVKGAFLSGAATFGYTNQLALVSGDTVEIASGRGADNNHSASYLNSDLLIEPVGVVAPPPDIAFTPAAGSFTNQVNVGMVNNVGAGSEIRYTINDVDPTSGSLLYTGSLTINGNATIRARLFANGSAVSAVFTNAYTKANDVQFGPAPGFFTNVTTVSLVNLVGSGQMRYTINGSDPTAGSTLYSTPLTITSSATFRAGLFLNGFPISTVSTGAYTQVLAEGIKFGPAPGLFTNQLTIRLTNTFGSGEMRFTINGAAPTASSPLYAGAFTITSNATIRAGLFLSGATISAVSTGDYGRVYALDDGVPNSWRLQYFGAGYLTDSRVGAGTDADGDGSSNLQEYLAGTDPLNPLSGFTVGIEAIPRVRFTSVPGTTYKILRRDNANSLTGVEVGQVTAVGTQTTFIDTSVSNPTGFYTVQAVP